MKQASEHAADAESFARDNPQWRWSWRDSSLTGPAGQAAVYTETWRGGYWQAYPPKAYRPLGGRFRSLASAIKSLEP